MASLVVCISLFCAICLINLHTFTCKRILILPFLNTSHTIILNAVASPLAARGHSVSFMWANEFTQRAISRHPNYTLLEFSTNMKPEELEEAVRAIHENFASPQKVSNPFRPETGWLSKLRNYFEMGRAGSRLGESVSKIANAVCKAVLSDKALMARLRDSRFDIALVDDFFLTRCLFLIPHLLEIPYVSVGETASWWDMRLPLLPANLIGLEKFSLSAGPSLSDRLSALVMIIVRDLILKIPVLRFYSEENLKLANVSSFSDYLSLPSRSSLFLCLWDDLMTGIALPKLPHIEFIGGVTAGPANELKSELKDWADNATNGFVVCTFGSMLTKPTDSMLEKLFHLFSELQPLPVIFRLSREHLPIKLVSKVSQNVLLMDWLPQNDLLGHPNARLFITHAGTNGYGEALYHGVPLMAFPLMVPQKIMSAMIETLGYGREASLFTMNDTVLAAIAKEVLSDTRYRQRVGKVSRIMKSRKHPGEVAADAVEHVLEFGSDHLLPYGSLSLNVIQFYMLDVLLLMILLLIGGLVIATFLYLKIIQCVFRLLVLRFNKRNKAKIE